MEYDTTFVENLCIKGVPSDEVETIVTFSKLENEAIIYTTDNTVLTKLKKQIKSNPDEWKIIRISTHGSGKNSEELQSIEISCPKKYVSFKSSNRKMSEEQKRKASERFKKMWKNKQ